MLAEVFARGILVRVPLDRAEPQQKSCLSGLGFSAIGWFPGSLAFEHSGWGVFVLDSPIVRQDALQIKGITIDS